MTFQPPHNEWNEFDAAQRSQIALAVIAMHGPPSVSQRELDRARRDAMRAMVVGLPDPTEVARRLETGFPEVAEVLRQAWISKKQPYCGVWRVADCEETPDLRSLGLVGWIGREPNMGCAVGGFGLLVRKALLDLQETEGDA